jgi:hypothetical protein
MITTEARDGSADAGTFDLVSARQRDHRFGVSFDVYSASPAQQLSTSKERCSGHIRAAKVWIATSP